MTRWFRLIPHHKKAFNARRYCCSLFGFFLRVVLQVGHQLLPAAGFGNSDAIADSQVKGFAN